MKNAETRPGRKNASASVERVKGKPNNPRRELSYYMHVASADGSLLVKSTDSSDVSTFPCVHVCLCACVHVCTSCLPQAHLYLFPTFSSPQAHQYKLVDIANCHAIETSLAVIVGQEKSEDLYKCYVYECSDSLTAVKAQNAVAAACQANFVSLRDSVRKRTREPIVVAQPLPAVEESVVDDATGFDSTIAALTSLAARPKADARHAFVNETYEASPLLARKELPDQMETSIMMSRPIGGGSVREHAVESTTDIIALPGGHNASSSTDEKRIIYHPSSGSASSADGIARRGAPTRTRSLQEQAAAIKIAVHDSEDEGVPRHGGVRVVREEVEEDGEVFDLDAVADASQRGGGEDGDSVFELEGLLAADGPREDPQDMTELEELLLQGSQS